MNPNCCEGADSPARKTCSWVCTGMAAFGAPAPIPLRRASRASVGPDTAACIVYSHRNSCPAMLPVHDAGKRVGSQRRRQEGLLGCTASYKQESGICVRWPEAAGSPTEGMVGRVAGAVTPLTSHARRCPETRQTVGGKLDPFHIGLPLGHGLLYARVHSRCSSAARDPLPHRANAGTSISITARSRGRQARLARRQTHRVRVGKNETFP